MLIANQVTLSPPASSSRSNTSVHRRANGSGWSAATAGDVAEGAAVTEDGAKRAAIAVALEHHLLR
jgi:hypothetical protein